MRRVESNSPRSSLYGHHSIDVGCMDFVRLYSVEKPTSQPANPQPQGILRAKLLEAGRTSVAGRVTEEVWTKWSPDSK